MTFVSTDELNLIEHPCQKSNITDESFKYKLYERQKQVLFAMQQLEKQPTIINNTQIIAFNKARLAASFSFGKTIVSLALIKSGNEPIERSKYSNFNSKLGGSLITTQINYPRYLNTTLILVSASVLPQWKASALKCGLKILVISNQKELDTFCMLLLSSRRNNVLEKYDAVLLFYKAYPDNTISPWTPNIEPISTISKLLPDRVSTINIVAMLTADTEWKRFIVDDFDSIKIANDMVVPSRFSWYISTTLDTARVTGLRKFNRDEDICTISNVNGKIMSVGLDTYLIKSLSIYASLAISLPKINIITYMFRTAQIINKIINDLEYSDDVVERINCGDIAAAALALNITTECNNIGQFLEALFEKNKASYYQAQKTYERCKQVIAAIETLDLFVDEGIEFRTDVHTLYSRLEKVDEVEFEEIINTLTVSQNDYRYINGTLIPRARAAFKSNEQILERFKSNIEEGECQKCAMEPEENTNRYILRCCNILLCEQCMINRSTQIFIKNCPSCQASITQGSVVSIKPNVELSQFLDYNLDDAVQEIKKYHSSIEDEEAECSDDSMSNDESYSPIRNLEPKMRTIVELIKGVAVTASCNILLNQRSDIHRNLIEDGEHVPLPQTATKKFLIFTKHQKIGYDIVHTLENFSISATLLKGSVSTIAKQIQEYKTSKNMNVLVLVSSSICAGLNLECTTHIIFHHSIMNRDIHEQLIGRAHRIGRESSLNLIYLNNSGERNLL